ncbi:MAG: mechanosensitive ion channel [Anaerolineae bacterium]|jgi:MscS family membrane protein|nr:mechanosensitive ion channel [Anaerolineae bacterium]
MFFEQLFSNLNPEFLQLALTRVLAIILALVLIWALRHLLSWLVIRPLRFLTKRTNQQFDEALLDASVVPVRLLLIGLSLSVSVAIMGLNNEPTFWNIIQQITRTLVILAIIIFTFNLTDLIIASSGRVFTITGITLEERLLPFIRVAMKFLIIAIGVVIIVQEWGYDVSGLVAGIGLGGLAFSLAAQDTVANIFGFVAIVGDRPFNVGDYIKTPDVEGVVEHVGLRSTRVRQIDQAVVAVPNNKLANSAILNWSRLTKRRIEYLLKVRYDTSSPQMRSLVDRIRQFLQAQEKVEKQTVVVHFMNFGEASLEIFIRAYVKIAEWNAFVAEQERINLSIMDIVNNMGLNIALPAQILYVENTSDEAVFDQDNPATKSDTK